MLPKYYSEQFVRGTKILIKKRLKKLKKLNVMKIIIPIILCPLNHVSITIMQFHFIKSAMIVLKISHDQN